MIVFCSSSRQITGWRRLLVELAGIGLLQPDDVSGELGHGALHAQADAEEGDAALPGEADGVDLALDAPFAESAGHEDSIDAG